MRCARCGLEAVGAHDRYCPALADGQERLSIPEADPNYIISDQVFGEVLRVIDLCEEAPQNLMITGPRGSGKSSLALQIGALRRSPTFLGHAYAWRSSDEVFGREWYSPEKGLYYVPSLFVEAIETPGATVIINDLPLMQNKTIQNGLNDLLDERLRQAWVDQIAKVLGRPIRVAPRVLIIATMNDGLEYTGNIRLAENILDRFSNRIYLDYPPADVQREILARKVPELLPENAERLVAYADSLITSGEAGLVISIRSLIQAARKMARGASLHEALWFSYIAGLPLDLQEKAMASLEKFVTLQEKDAMLSVKYLPWASLEDHNE